MLPPPCPPPGRTATRETPEATTNPPTTGSPAPSLGRRRRRLGHRLLLVATSLVLGALGLEVGLRVWSALTLRGRGLVFDPELGWRMQPGLRRRGSHWSDGEPVETNSMGFRDRERPLARLPGVRRIVALGDSFTFGMGVDHAQRFTEVLERTVDRLEVVNLGVNAYGPDQELRLLETEALAYRPDVVLCVVFPWNDLEDVRFERRQHWPKPCYRLYGGELELDRPEPDWDVWLRSTSYLGEVVLRGLDRFLPSSRLSPQWETADTLPLVVALLARAEAACAAQGARFLVVLAPLHDGVRAGAPTHVDERVRQALDARALPCLALFDALHATASPFLPDGHWTATGHAAAATAIARDLQRRGWLPGV